MNPPEAAPIFPQALFEWSGNRSGGVKRIFDVTSGRPSGTVLVTPLLKRLEQWAEDYFNDVLDTPSVVLLIGGPGNGKTEAVEVTVNAFDSIGKFGGALIGALEPSFANGGGELVPRKASASVTTHEGKVLKITIVQDASVAESSELESNPATSLLDDLGQHACRETAGIYIACVNRGVLDDAHSIAIERGLVEVTALLSTIIRAVSLMADGPPCWPLSGYPRIAIWPMDVESLLIKHAGVGADSVGRQIIDAATEESKWPVLGECEARDKCPYCRSRALLSGEPYRTSLLTILRQFELATGKRWTFRDLFSLFSFLLAGSESTDRAPATPCASAARLSALDSSMQKTPEAYRAPYILAAALYQHALFGDWPRLRGRGLKKDLKDLRLDDDRTLMGLHYFLTANRRTALTPTLSQQLDDICSVLDPALADPDQMVGVSGRSAVEFRELDARFSHSVKDGLQFIKKYQCLSPLEIDLLQRLERADDKLSSAEVRRTRPATADRVQTLVRDFSCRIVRRSLGTRAGITLEASILSDFQRVLDGNEQLLHKAVKEVETLLNGSSNFVVGLNTTFGEPIPAETRRAVLLTTKQRVRPAEITVNGRPIPTLRFLRIGDGAAAQAIPLTYELYKSVRELQSGMLAAAMPRTVIALLDTTKARLAGRIVRDEELLEGAEIHLGLRPDIIVRELRKFVIRNEV